MAILCQALSFSLTGLTWGLSRFESSFYLKTPAIDTGKSGGNGAEK
jgi:hypothetical protein